MAVFNGEDTIDATVASILGQTHRDLELVIVDDGSTDSTPERLAAWAAADARVRVLGDGINRGRSAARNHAIAHADAEWIATCDADDLYSPTRLADLLAVVADNPGTALISDDIMSFSVGGDGSVSLGHRFPSRRTWRSGRIAPLDRRAWALDKRYMTPLIRRDFLDESGATYPIGLSNAEDMAFFSELVFARRDPAALWFGFPRYYYRTGESNRPANMMGNAIVGFQTAIEHTGSRELAELLGAIVAANSAISERGAAVRADEGRVDAAETELRVVASPLAGYRRLAFGRLVKLAAARSDRSLRPRARREIEELLTASAPAAADL